MSAARKFQLQRLEDWIYLCTSTSYGKSCIEDRYKCMLTLKRLAIAELNDVLMLLTIASYNGYEEGRRVEGEKRNYTDLMEVL